MDVFYFYSYGTLAWSALQAIPLMSAPTLITALLAPETRDPTILEAYFCRTTALALLTIGVLTVLLTGSVPLTASLSADLDENAASADPRKPTAPYAMPTLVITLAYHVATSFYMYAMYMQTGQTSFALGMTFSGLLTAIGIWVFMFGTSDGHISRRTGADKRTSGFPFQNTEADKKRKGKKSI